MRTTASAISYHAWKEGAKEEATGGPVISLREYTE